MDELKQVVEGSRQLHRFEAHRKDRHSTADRHRDLARDMVGLIGRRRDDYDEQPRAVDRRGNLLGPWPGGHNVVRGYPRAQPDLSERCPHFASGTNIFAAVAYEYVSGHRRRTLKVACVSGVDVQ
ncbi:MAG: hypothetical protein ABI725_03045 [Chloroflexota bacterium]